VQTKYFAGNNVAALLQLFSRPPGKKTANGYLFLHSIFGHPFVKRFALCYRTVVCVCYLSVCDVGVLWLNGWMDQDATWYRDRPRPRWHCVRWGSMQLPLKRGTADYAPTFWAMYIEAKRLDESKCHLVRRQASALATLC